MSDSSISIVMPVYNGLGFIEKSLPPLLAIAARGEVCEVIVVDDGSTDDSVQYARDRGCRILYSGGKQTGPGGARNAAARDANGDILWFVDADVIAHDDAVQYIHEAFSEPDVVAMIGSYDDEPEAQNFLSQYKNLVHHFYHHRGRREASTFWGGCGAVRKDVFLKLGGFDVARYPRPSVEDVEMGYRLKGEGRILLIPEFQGTHLKVWRTLNLFKTEIFDRAIPWSRLMMSSGGVLNDLNVSQAERLRAILAALALLSTVAVIAGYFPLWTLLVVGIAVWLGNLELARLFVRRKGWFFALRGIAFHQLYYLYSSAAFAWCWLEHKISPKVR